MKVIKTPDEDKLYKITIREKDPFKPRPVSKQTEVWAKDEDDAIKKAEVPDNYKVTDVEKISG